MNVVARNDTADNRDIIFRANTSDNFTDPTLDIPSKHLEAVLGRPHHMITMIENAVFAFIIVHDHTFQKNEPQAQPSGSFFWKVWSFISIRAEAMPSEDGGFKPEKWILNIHAKIE